MLKRKPTSEPRRASKRVAVSPTSSSSPPSSSSSSTTTPLFVVKLGVGRRGEPKSETGVACPEPGCARSFESRRDLEAHARKHASKTPYACRLCVRAFAWRASCADHERTHDVSDRAARARSSRDREPIGVVDSGAEAPSVLFATDAAATAGRREESPHFEEPPWAIVVGGGGGGFAAIFAEARRQTDPLSASPRDRGAGGVVVLVEEDDRPDDVATTFDRGTCPPSPTRFVDWLPL